MRRCHCQLRQTLYICFVTGVFFFSFKVVLCDFKKSEVTAGHSRSCSQHNCTDSFTTDQSTGKMIFGSGSGRCPSVMLSGWKTSEWVMTFLALGQLFLTNAKHTGLGCIHAWLAPPSPRLGSDRNVASSCSQRRRQAQITCWQCGFSSTQTVTLQWSIAKSDAII